MGKMNEHRKKKPAMDSTKSLQIEGDNATGDAAHCSKKVRKSPSLEEKIPSSPLKKIFKKDVTAKPESNNEDGEEEDTRDNVMKHVQQLMDNLEKKRDTDKNMLEEFRTKMHGMVDSVCQQVEDKISNLHEETNQALKTKLAKLNEVLSKVCELENEFGQAKDIVGHIYQDI